MSDDEDDAETNDELAGMFKKMRFGGNTRKRKSTFKKRKTLKKRLTKKRKSLRKKKHTKKNV